MSFKVHSLGSHIRVNFAGGAVNPDDVALISQTWSRCVTRSQTTSSHEIVVFVDQDEANRIVARRGGARVFSTLEECNSILPAIITLTAIENASTNFMLMHAAAVSDVNNGNVIGLIGPSGAGKTTAVRALSSSFGYVTDETLAVDITNGAVLAYPKPLSVINSHNPAYKNQLGPDQLGLQTAPAQMRLAQLYFLNRNPQHIGKPLVSEVSLKEAVSLLLPQLSYLARRTKPMHDLLKLVRYGSGIRKLTYSSAEDLSDYVGEQFRLLAETTVRFPTGSKEKVQLRHWQEEHDEMSTDNIASLEVPTSPVESDSFLQVPSSYVVKSSPLVDPVNLDGQVLVMIGGLVTVIQGMGVDVLELSQQQIAFVDLAEQLELRHGAPESGNVHRFVAEMVIQLAGIGALTFEPKDTPHPR